jgi:hypothetical protein
VDRQGAVLPFTFTSSSKSNLGWDFLAIVDSGHWQEPVFEDLPGSEQLRYQNEFFEQLTACQFEVSDNASRTMRWSVPATARHPVSGEPMHDDWICSAALASLLEKMDWKPASPALIIPAADPLKEMEGKF